MLLVGREEAARLPPPVEVGLDGGRLKVFLGKVEGRRGRSGHRVGHQSDLLSLSPKQKRRLVQGRAASWYHPGSARNSPCLISPVTGGPDPARGRPSEPLARRPFTRWAPSLSV